MGCEWRERVYRLTYELDGDGDGIGFLVETAYLIDGGRATVAVDFSARGLRQSA